MRTTLSLDDDVALAARQEAARRKVSLGTAASDLIRMGLKARSAQRVADKASATVGPFAILPPRDELITPEHIRCIQEKEGV